MKHEYMCRSKEELKCIYITEENIEEFVNTYGVHKDGEPAKHTIRYENEYAIVQYEKMRWRIRLNAFMVEELDGWTGYTDEMFSEYYEITM